MHCGILTNRILDKDDAEINHYYNKRQMKHTTKVIGISGGIASGKSTVAQMLVSLGAHLIDADKICHLLLETREIRSAIKERWGNRVEDKSGRISRHMLGNIVFRDKRELSALNQIIHPSVIKLIKNKIYELTVHEKVNVIVIDAALLVETSLVDLCDTVLFVKTDRTICEKRALINRQWSWDEIEKRERFQGSMKDKVRNADVLLDNGSSKTNTMKQVKDFWKQFTVSLQFGGKNGYNKN